MTQVLRHAVPLFLAFAFSYLLSALLRGVTATLAPVFSAELGLGSADLGLLAAAYFLGFAALQLPLGRALDRHGPRRTLAVLLCVATAGCAAFALAEGLWALVAARVLIGAGVSAGLMAALTSFRRHYAPAAQQRANAWMLMTGSLGLLASTLPVQWLLPLAGWRPLFWGLALCLLLAALLVAWLVPRDAPAPPPDASASVAAVGYRQIVRQPIFLRLAPPGFVIYGGMIAVQTLWAGPWLTRVSGLSPEAAAQGLFGLNLAMMCSFFAWGVLLPRLSARGVTAERLCSVGLPLSLVMLGWIVWLGPAAGAWHWTAWCVLCTCGSVLQPAVGQAYRATEAGRALSAYNLVIFAGVFLVQWGLGLAVDALARAGLSEVDAFRAAFAGYAGLGVVSLLWFLRRPGVSAPGEPR